MLVWPPFAAPHLFPGDIERLHARRQGCATQVLRAYNSRVAGMEVRAVNEGTVPGWYRVTMNYGEYKAKGKALEDGFESQFEYHGQKEGAALFSRKDEKSATWEYYFTPEAVAFSLGLIKEFAWGQEYAWGQACSAPSATLKNLSLCKGKAGEKYAHLLPSSKNT